tara:strand:- start:4625 stop:4846 length:222 start_codon:yes stop_codon:yes gene_type:complete
VTKQKHEARVALAKAADELVNEVSEGKWDHVPELNSSPIEDLNELFEELERRCPGHGLEEYRDAYARSYIANR